MMNTTCFTWALLCLFVAVRCQSCVYTQTHCACSRKSALYGAEECYNPVETADINSAQFGCIGRACKESYVCDCAGKSYCSHKRVMRNSIVHLGNSMCTRQAKVATDVALVNEKLEDIIKTGPARGKPCVFTDEACTCSTTSALGHHHACLDFEKETPQGAVCLSRDCKDAHTCDCGGNQLCSRKVMARKIWKAIAPVPGTPGRKYCNEETFSGVTLSVVDRLNSNDGNAIFDDEF